MDRGGVGGKKLESRVGRKHTAVSAAKAAFSCVNTPPLCYLWIKNHILTTVYFWYTMQYIVSDRPYLIDKFLSIQFYR